LRGEKGGDFDMTRGEGKKLMNKDVRWTTPKLLSFSLQGPEEGDRQPAQAWCATMGAPWLCRDTELEIDEMIRIRW